MSYIILIQLLLLRFVTDKYIKIKIQVSLSIRLVTKCNGNKTFNVNEIGILK